MRKANRAAAGAAAWQVIQNTDNGVSLWQRAKAVPRMVGAKLRGRYPQLSGARLLAMAAMALYIVSPVDLIPELFIPILGLADDVAVAVWLTTITLGESERFVLWERQGHGDQTGPAQEYAQAQQGQQGEYGQQGYPGHRGHSDPHGRPGHSEDGGHHARVLHGEVIPSGRKG